MTIQKQEVGDPLIAASDLDARLAHHRDASHQEHVGQIALEEQHREGQAVPALRLNEGWPVAASAPIPRSAKCRQSGTAPRSSKVPEQRQQSLPPFGAVAREETPPSRPGCQYGRYRSRRSTELLPA